MIYSMNCHVEMLIISKTFCESDLICFCYIEHHPTAVPQCLAKSCLQQSLFKKSTFDCEIFDCEIFDCEIFDCEICLSYETSPNCSAAVFDSKLFAAISL